ncbi:hypothetical protein M011DRAFT_526736 [Sporormia fimetaria CBS 119925]|uniref:Uncharacterized protein n=1 Tax=Sporormia fimetaria CBS 119925 TaxID=1340428 RepID=A0A6A6V7F9_9PLEO|nr:hypothetical protein M011DRAFT_526736 [Sporormia fimetaria CBS 119925]
MPAYPRLGLDLRHNAFEKRFFPSGAHQGCSSSKSGLLPVRELAMLSSMESLTETEDWDTKIFDEDIVSKWREETLAILDERLWALSLEAKFQKFDRSEAGRFEGVQDDNPEVPPLKGIMNENAFDCCIQELRSKAKYYEATGMIPTLDACAAVVKSDRLVSSELRQCLRVAFDRLKSDQVTSPPESNNMIQDLVDPSMYPLVYGKTRAIKEEVSIPLHFWSELYQWMPSNVALQPDGKCKFTSYINNLHPERYPEIYRSIESLIETALPMWGQCLALAGSSRGNEGPGRRHSRFPKPEDPDDENDKNWEPSIPKPVADEFIEWSTMKPGEDEAMELLSLLRKPRIPEASFIDVNYHPVPGKRLVERYSATGLQVVVRMISIELTPEKSEFPEGAWHVEGMINEHICATALYYLDDENVTDSSLSFRIQTSSYLSTDDPHYQVQQGSFRWLERIYGTSLEDFGPCLENYGTVKTCEGRLLAFPYVFQNRVSSFRLADPTKPGHRRFIALLLVDPNKRIISTANVPPQQFSWWTDESLRCYFDTGSNPNPPPMMTVEEAQGHRRKLMHERNIHLQMADREWTQHTYNFD